VADRLGLYVQAYTLYSSVRPFGISSILAAVDKEGPALYVIEPSGVFYVSSTLAIMACLPMSGAKGYNGAAVGKGRQLAKTELEKLKMTELSTREAVMEAARMFVSHCFTDG
jgi:20S proteasome subunit alpha 7